MTDQVKVADELRHENGALRVQVQNLHDELAATTNQADISIRLDNIADQLARLHSNPSRQNLPPNPSNVKTTETALLLGDGILHNVKDITTNDGRRVEALVSDGATPEKLVAKLEDPRLLQNVKDITIVCGSASLPKDGSSTTPKNAIAALLDKATSLGKPVTVSSVPPLAESVLLDIADMNSFLAGECQKLGASFISHEKNFLFQDGSRDDSCFLKDSPRLSDLGKDRFLGNLSMRRVKPQLRPGSKASKPRFQHPRTATHPSEASHQRIPSSTRRHDNTGTFQPTPGQCNRCGEGNHAAKFCKHKDRVTCHTCGEKGHKSKHHLP